MTTFDHIGDPGDLIDVLVGAEVIEGLDTEMVALNLSITSVGPPSIVAYTDGWLPPPGCDKKKHEETGCWKTSGEYNDALIQWIRDWVNYRAWLWDWAEFFTKWNGWKNSHYSTLSRTGSLATQEFENFRNQYNGVWLRDYKRMHPEAPTSAKEYADPQGGLLGSGAQSTIKVVALAAAVIGGFLILREVNR